MNNQNITLYPSNWLYNAGVIGLSIVLESLGEELKDGEIEKITKNSDDIFGKWEDLSPKSKKGRSMVYGFKSAYYSNQTKRSIKNKINALINENVSQKTGKIIFSCIFCANQIQTSKTKATFLNQAFGNILLGSERTFNNMYWNNISRDFVCPKCEFIIMCHHLAFTRLSDGSEIFINAPSFKAMYYLNRFVRETYGSSDKQETREKREILAMSVIEYATKIQATLGVWTWMNIEVISKYKVKLENNKWEDKIEFFSLPYEVIQIISDRKIAAILSDIGEFKILNLVLNQHYSELVELGYRLLREALSEKKNDKFIDYWLYQYKNKNNLNETANKILNLYTLIEEKIKTEVSENGYCKIRSEF